MRGRVPSKLCCVTVPGLTPDLHAALAQSAERLTRNEKVVGSIPTGGSSKHAGVRLPIRSFAAFDSNVARLLGFRVHFPLFLIGCSSL